MDFGIDDCARNLALENTDLNSNSLIGNKLSGSIPDNCLIADLLGRLRETGEDQ
jgi:hypothetical protein